MKERLVELLLSKSCMTNECPDVDCNKCECIAVHIGDADKIADYPGIHHIVKLLKNIANQQWKCKCNNMPGNIALGHIHILAAFGCKQMEMMAGCMFGWHSRSLQYKRFSAIITKNGKFCNSSHGFFSDTIDILTKSCILNHN